MLYSIIGENVLGLVQLMKTSTIAFSQMMQFTVVVLNNVKFKHLGQLLLVLLIKHQNSFFSIQRKLDTFKLGGLTFSSSGSTKAKDSKSYIYPKEQQSLQRKLTKSTCLSKFIWKNGRILLLRAGMFYTLCS